MQMIRTVDVAGCPVGAAVREVWVAHLLGCIAEGTPHHHVSLNAAKWVAMRADARLHRAVRQATSVAADGSAIVLASRWLGDPLPEKVAGCDLAHELLQRAPKLGLRVALFGADRVTLAEVERRSVERGVNIVFARDGYAADEEHALIAQAIAQASPDLLLVAMGTPKSEIFVSRFALQMGVPLAMGVGGCLDVMAGTVRRAPAIVSRLHLEWAWRFLSSPKARFRRAILDSLRFVYAIVRHERLS